MEIGLNMCSYFGMIPLYISCIAGRYPNNRIFILQETARWRYERYAKPEKQPEETKITRV